MSNGCRKFREGRGDLIDTFLREENFYAMLASICTLPLSLRLALGGQISHRLQGRDGRCLEARQTCRPRARRGPPDVWWDCHASWVFRAFGGERHGHHPGD